MSNELDKAYADFGARMIAEDAKLAATIDHIQKAIAAAEIENTTWRDTLLTQAEAMIDAKLAAFESRFKRGL